MSKNHDGAKRAFIQYSRSYWAKILHDKREWTDEVMFGYTHPDGGTSGEMAVRWYWLGKENCAQLEVFEDAWHALATFTDVIAAMGEHDSQTIQPDEFVTLLLGLGFEDRTPLQSPYEPVEKTE